MGTLRAPAGLGAAGRRLWRDVLAVYELAPGEMEMLRQAARVADVITRLDAELAQAPGLTTVGSTGQPRSHPLLDSLAAQRRVLAECIRSMALPFPDEERGRRRVPAAAESARERWRQRGAG
jgi:hypothetical protein